jgi:Fe-S-cluster containining protein
VIDILRAIVKGRRAGLLRLRKAVGPIALDCRGGECGRCCQVLGGGVVISKAESVTLPLSAVTKSARGLILKSAPDGSCGLLQHKACSQYKNRPRGCREYPWYRIEGVLYYDAGCPGLTGARDERPDPATLAEARNYFLMSRPLQRAILLLLRIW